MDQLLRYPSVQHLLELYGREQILVQVRAHLDALRSDPELAADPGGEALERRLRELPAALERAMEAELGSPVRRVLNATGILLHTNLGRAPLPRRVASALPAQLDAYCDLEFDLATGRRGERNRRADRLLCALTGAEAALVVNNNAASLVLILAALARDRSVVVSRGELVEIGGSFRIADILEASGARLAEVGSTNRTRLEDYRRAIGAETALLLKVHPSNYRISGFVEQAGLAELAALGERHDLPVVFDEGSGLLRPHPSPQLADHPSFTEALAAGCALVCGSGDKLLGGPQAGLIAGRRELVERCRRHPLYRALRPDRAALSTLEAVLRLHLAGRELPLDRLWADTEEHRQRVRRLAERCGAEVVSADAFVGGGAAPERPIVGEALALPGSRKLLDRLRTGDPPVVGYLRNDRLILDLRTVDPLDDELLAAAVARAAAG